MVSVGAMACSINWEDVTHTHEYSFFFRRMVAPEAFDTYLAALCVQPQPVFSSSFLYPFKSIIIAGNAGNPGYFFSHLIIIIGY